MQEQIKRNSLHQEKHPDRMHLLRTRQNKNNCEGGGQDGDTSSAGLETCSVDLEKVALRIWKSATRIWKLAVRIMTHNPRIIISVKLMVKMAWDHALKM